MCVTRKEVMERKEGVKVKREVITAMFSSLSFLAIFTLITLFELRNCMSRPSRCLGA